MAFHEACCCLNALDEQGQIKILLLGKQIIYEDVIDGNVSGAIMHSMVDSMCL